MGIRIGGDKQPVKPRSVQLAIGRDERTPTDGSFL